MIPAGAAKTAHLILPVGHLCVLCALCGQKSWSGKDREASPQLIGPSAIHPHALDGLDANQLYRGIVSAVFFERQSDEFVSGMAEVMILANDDRNLRGCKRSVEAVTGKHQNVPGQQLVLVQIDVDKYVCAQRSAQNMAAL